MLRKVLAVIFTALAVTLAAHLFDGTRLFKDSLKEKGRERQQSPRAVSHVSLTSASRLLLKLLLLGRRDHAEHEGEPIEIQHDRERR